jgi:ketopantoate reductase
MMQNSLERLFEGLAVSLRESVLPAVTDPYARSQVKAAIELLGNLSTRVEWRRDQIEELVDRISRALSAAGLEAPPRTDDLLDDRSKHLAALASAAGANEPHPAIREAIEWQLRTEMELLRTGAYR